MALIIKKKVSLDFLGEEYKDAYLQFKAIPLKDYEALQEEIAAIGEDVKKSISFISNKIDQYFLTGKAPDENGKMTDVTKEDLGNLDQESVLKCFEVLTGQNISREDDFLEPSSKKPSSTMAENPTNS